MNDIYETRNPMPPLSVEERLTVLEILFETLMFAAFENQPALKREWAETLLANVQSMRAHDRLPEPVLRAITAHADRLADIDRYADWLKASLRPGQDRPGVGPGSGGGDDRGSGGKPPPLLDDI